ncbi:hypothetical protein DY000_02006055 [Brassica cretica]|uniref:Uncharacterized protein n=1 Tax=Brassica cretica TaxID=69181 RepID=A0ABQ7CDM7_BRACR|nr:hypothetical protein DY000_02006055 [Brassica cretica]
MGLNHCLMGLDEGCKSTPNCYDDVEKCVVELLRYVVSSRLATMKSAGDVRTVITSARACTRV